MRVSTTSLATTTAVLLINTPALAQAPTTPSVNLSSVFTGTLPTYPTTPIILISPPTSLPALAASVMAPPTSASGSGSGAVASFYRIACATPSLFSSPVPTCPYPNDLTITQDAAAAHTYEATWRADPGQSANVVRCSLSGTTAAHCSASDAGATAWRTMDVNEAQLVIRDVAVTAGAAAVAANTTTVPAADAATTTPAVTSVTATSNRVGTATSIIGGGVGGSSGSSAIASSLSSAAASASMSGTTTMASVTTSYGSGTGTAVNSAFTPASTSTRGVANAVRGEGMGMVAAVMGVVAGALGMIV